MFLSNVETFARIAVASRGSTATSALLTLSGAVQRPGVVELPEGATLSTALDVVGAWDPVILVTGGWHGVWLPWREDLRDLPMRREAFAEAGARWGAGVLVVLGPDPAPRQVLQAVAAALAADSAGQCGPCREGLPELARVIAAGGDPRPVAAATSGRGLCAHPTAAAAALVSGAAAVAAWERVQVPAWR